MSQNMELLAPAGDEAALRAAVNAGADAVYLGYTQFGARASAANFDAEGLDRAIAYAHLHHVRVHVALNTLVKQSELQSLQNALATVVACHADAVIVQDLGVARLARETYPSLTLHASTQMALHSASGAQFAQSQGFRRVVLARECALDTIAEVSRTGIETEVFVHGALCASVSGQCLLSSMAGGRSGNRGRCAQPCRQEITLGDTSAALLSMRDLCLRDHLPELLQAGVTSLKIEGRLKRAAYVAVVTEIYRKALDALARGEFQPMDAREKTALLQIFHRGGFTVGHALGAEDADLCAIERVGHGGVNIGAVRAVQGGLATLALTAALHDGDSLRVGKGAEDVELRYAGHEETRQATLRIRPGAHVRPGDPVDRLTDAEQLRHAESLAEPTIPIFMHAEVFAGRPIALTACDGADTVQAFGETAQVPLTRALTHEDITRSLTKLGETPFTLGAEPEVDTDSAFAPLSALNALRRDALEKLTAARQETFFRGNQGQFLPAPDRNISASTSECVSKRPAEKPGIAPPQDFSITDTLCVSFSDASMAEPLRSAGANMLLFTPKDFHPDLLKTELRKLPPDTWLALPPQFGDALFRQMRPYLAENEPRLAGVVLGCVGQLGLDIPLPIALGDGIPICNREAASALLTPDISFFTLWPELSYEELAALGQTAAPAFLRVYGRERVMLLNHCPERVARGLQASRAACGLCKPDDRACASRDAAFTDRRGFRFPLQRLRMPEGCVLEAYNALPTDLSRQESRRRTLGAGMLVSFTVETAQQQLTVTQRYAALLKGISASAPEEQVTGGHFLRGIE